MSEMGQVGKVSRQRYDELVTESRELVAQEGRIQFKLGDNALEIEPSQSQGGQRRLPDDEPGVEETIAVFADDVGVAPSTMLNYRFVAAKWPAEHRVSGVSLDIHRILAGREDRFEVIKHPPKNRRGLHRWTQDSAKRVVGWRPDTPRSVQEKVEAVHDLVADETVAARVATDLLRRPDVAAKAMADDTARHLANQAQAKRIGQAEEDFRAHSPAGPAVRRIDRAIEFLDLVGACQAFVAASGRIVPRLRDRTLSQDEQAIVHKNVDKVKATCEWIETAVDTGEVDADEALVRLLRGQ